MNNIIMKIIVLAKIAIKNLHSNKGRTTLSLLGIVIGITAVIMILSMGEGLRNFVSSQVESFGTDIIEVETKVPKTSQMSAQNVGGMAGGVQVTTLKLADIEAVAKNPNISGWYAGILSQQIVSYKTKTSQSFILGATSDMISVDKGSEIAAGRMFSQQEDNNLKQVVVLGSKIKKDFFHDENAVGKRIKIKGQTYKVLGVMKERGATGAFDFDKIVFMPIQTLQKKMMGVSHIQFAIFKLKNMALEDQTTQETINILRRRHDIKYEKKANADAGLDDDFAVTSIAEAKDMLNKVFIIIDALLLGLVSISLVVGGVGIMNVMYVAVVERTKEIGLRKSVGAKKFDILFQFIFEAILLTLLGGLVGITIGFLLTQLLTYFISKAGFVVQLGVSLKAIFIGIGFSGVTGLIFGFYPARNASRLNPAEALRKE